MYTTLLIDCDASSRTVLKNYLTTHSPDIEVIGECSCNDEALLVALKEKPSIIFMNLESCSGFSLIEKLNKIDYSPYIIVTASTLEILSIKKALRLSVVDYLIKAPDGGINVSKLILALERVRIRMSGSLIKSVNTGIFVKSIQGKYFQYQINHIAYLKSDGNCAILHFLSGEKKRTTQSLVQLEQKFTQFLRVGRAYLINMQQVESIDVRKRVCNFNDNLSIEFNRSNFTFLRTLLENK